MTVERYIRLIAGTFIMGSLALGHWVHPYWYFFTAFVGLNLFQSALTNWCLMDDILRKLGVGCDASQGACCCDSAQDKTADSTCCGTDSGCCGANQDEAAQSPAAPEQSGC